MPLWGSVTRVLLPHLNPIPLLDGILKRVRGRLVGEPGRLLACLPVIFGTSRDHLLNVLFFSSSAFSLSRTHCGLSSIAQISLLDKVRHQLSEKGESCSPVNSCFFPELGL